MGGRPYRVTLTEPCGKQESRIIVNRQGSSVQQDPDLIARSAEELVGDLNPQQAEAVQYRGALLIGAGAGSGKTRVLTRRIAWILTQFGAWPSQILAITFTNKAAAEMRERLEGLIMTGRPAHVGVDVPFRMRAHPQA